MLHLMHSSLLLQVCTINCKNLPLLKIGLYHLHAGKVLMVFDDVVVCGIVSKKAKNIQYSAVTGVVMHIKMQVKIAKKNTNF